MDTESGDTGTEGPPTQPLPDFAVKVLQLSGLTVEVGSSQLSNIRLDQSLDGIYYSVWLEQDYVYGFKLSMHVYVWF